MKLFAPLVLLIGLLAAGCNTPEDDFMDGAPLPATPQKPVSVETKTNTLTITPALTLPSDPEPAATKAAVMPVVPTAAKKPKIKKAAAPKTTVATTAPVLPIIITLDNSLAGKVLAYNSPGHFVVLEFPAGPMPKTGQSLFLYRTGLKVAEVKITGPERDNNTVADVVNGDAQAGDEVRDQ
jgi:hypothetical protein